MLTTKRYEYAAFDALQFHPALANHRGLNWDKVNHYERDILKNGLLEPLVVWERNPGELFLVGGFHRHSAIRAIRNKHPGYFDRVDVRVVAGELDEIRALNLKLNADRLDARITDFFDTIIYLNNANWTPAKIADFLDKSEAWVADIIRFVPGMDPRLRARLTAGRLTWPRAREICRRVLEAPPGAEKATADCLLAELDAAAAPRPRRTFTVRRAARRLEKRLARSDAAARARAVSLDAVHALLLALAGRAETAHWARLREAFPDLLDDTDAAARD